jgi:hypothetical protein
MPKKSKKYVVRLADAERDTLQQIVGKFKGSSPKVRRAQVLLKSDADGPDWTDAKIADALVCETHPSRQAELLWTCASRTVRSTSPSSSFYHPRLHRELHSACRIKILG